MDQLWKWVMHLNAKAFCLAATLGFFMVAAFCGWGVLHPTEPLKDGGNGSLPELPPAWELGTLNFVSNQLSTETLTLPVDPFRPTIEAIFTNETERAAFLKALKAAQNAAAGVTGNSANKKEDPFAHLRKKDTVPGGSSGPDGKPMVTPKLSFMGFFQRPDGKQAAMFYDSTTKQTVFYDAGKKVHGVEILNANVREAEIRFADGSTRKLAIGGEPIELAAEPDLNPPPKKVPPAKPGVAGKPGAPQPGVKPGAAKPVQGLRPKKPQPQP